MWFWLSLIAFFCWSGSDIFSKIGCADSKDKYSHLKMVTAVGVVMGLHAAYEIFIAGVEINSRIILTYLPVSAFYIISMAIGYFGLRYIELSISSPICNSSGALAAVFCIIAGDELDKWQYVAIALVSIGVILLGVVEAREDQTLRALRQEKANYKYAKSALAIIIPLLYCLIDAIGTFADSTVLFDDDYPEVTTFKLFFWQGDKLIERSANVAYELMFLVCGIIAFIFVKFIKKQKYLPKKEGPKYIGAIFETAGQLAYVYAISESDHRAMSAAIISAYCLLSVIWGRIFLKEKLSWKHYASIAIAVVGIIILGIYDP